MRCEAVRDALPALASGTLDGARAGAVRAHLATCADCAAEWRVVGAIARATIAAPADLADRVSAHVAQRPRPAAAGAPVALRWLGGAGLAAAAVIALVVAWPQRDVDLTRTLELPTSPVLTDPFLDEELFGATTPTEAELDGMIRVAAADPASLPRDVVAEKAPDDGELAPLAMDVGVPLGDWPGADGMSAGHAMLDDLTYEEMQLLLTEMNS